MSSEMGHEMSATINKGEKALAIIHADQSDLVFIAIELRGKLSGIGIAKEIKHLQIRIIFTTSFRDKKTVRRGKRPAQARLGPSVLKIK